MKKDGAAMADGSEYTGKYPQHVTRQDLVDFHTKKTQALLDCKPDGLAVETIPNLEEIGVVCQVLRDLQEKQESPPVACWISMACRNGKELNDGHSIQDALEVIRTFDSDGRWIAAVGVNCCDSVHIASLVQTLADACSNYSLSRGIVVYPNSGEAWDATHGEWKDGTGTTDTEFADRLMEVVELVERICKKRSAQEEGVGVPKVVLGGCCRTSDQTIAALRRRINAWNEQSN